MVELTDKQIANRKYYREHKAQILQHKKEYAQKYPERIRAKSRRYKETHPDRKARNTAFRRRCFICGGMIIQDELTMLYQCMNPDCEAEFKEIL